MLAVKFIKEKDALNELTQFNPEYFMMVVAETIYRNNGYLGTHGDPDILNFNGVVASNRVSYYNHLYSELKDKDYRDREFKNYVDLTLATQLEMEVI